MADKRLSLEEIFDFVHLMNDFVGIERVSRIGSLDRYENDSEHSYGLAMLAWYVVEANNLDLDLNKVIKYALVHDLVEVYAGDTFVYGNDDEIDSKKEREEKALRKIKKKFPKFAVLARIIDDFERREDKESKFVYALDKLHPMIQNYFDGGKLWKKFNIPLEKIVKEKQKKIANNSDVQKYFRELVEILENQKDLFPDEEKH